jgi:type VI secretion system protein ImpA
MIVAADLLKPISDESLCGEDLSDNAELHRLETLVRGKPETQFSAAEPPNWQEIRDLALDLFSRSKDLRVFVVLAAAELELDGFFGFKESLIILEGILDKYWQTVHPTLDPLDDFDPLQRVNIIATLGAPLATFGDDIRIVDRLRRVPLATSPTLGSYSYLDMLRAENPEISNEQPITKAQVDGAFRDTPLEKLEATYKAVADSLELTKRIDAKLTDHVSVSKAPNLNPLSTELTQIREKLAPYLERQGSALSSGSAPQVQTGATAVGQVVGSGQIRSRKDVVFLLDQICQFYAKNEPSSPVPLLLKRAARLAEMNFTEIVGDLTPEALIQLRLITGEKEPGNV